MLSSPTMAEESSHAAADRAKFDAYAADYEAVHRQNIAASGEDPDYFATYKLRCLERLVGDGWDQPVLDYGCGVGMVTQKLCERFSEVAGFDPSDESIDVARGRVPAARFHADMSGVPDGHYGLVIMSGVLHHVAPAERADVVARAIRKLRPGTGRLVVFEHNPLNPLTRRAVAMCPFDDDATLLWPWEARGLLSRAGLRDVTRKFIVFLPRALAALRWIEPHLGPLPIGAQMMLVGTRGPA